MEANPTIKMFACTKYNLTMLDSKSREFCAKRHELSLNENDTLHSFEKCRTCERGMIMHELGHHKVEGACKRYSYGRLNVVAAVPVPAKALVNDTPKKSGTLQPQGETTMVKEIKKSCGKHGDYTTNRTNGRCPQCLSGNKPVTAKARGTRGGLIPRTPDPGPLSHLGAASINIDLTRFPKLHSRLLMIGLNTVLDEMETKA